METRAGLGKRIVAPEVAQAPGARAPLVEIAHHHRRMPMRAGIDMIHDRRRLLAPPKPRQIEMHAEHTDHPAGELHVGHHRAARLKGRQV